MQTVLVYLALLISGLGLQAQNAIDVSITNIKSNEGTLKVGLYNSEATFLATTFISKNSAIENNRVIVTFEDVPDGTYAISTFHDEDNNGKLNMMMGMIPSEDYACSNGAKGFFGPPKWKDASFEINNDESKSITIKM
ncbi:DUF2141 domain-containing protein [Patiriisocius hiemis]|uniref:DUF2141 domain-containing protein n=1 Tax=Patiriisocius hiemis TaxID=3075604 RepID=A0ABU2Y8A1_9FLAO|nr:DUF2141 domain-containing protein [Constantimarinum sp. W242]MDT0554423.1 DUF2141 domain-containing protein [Constantimarinum sp. W242]